jgi:glycolate oxidase FAD binding subunit
MTMRAPIIDIRDAADAAEALRNAAAHDTPYKITGAGSKKGLGRHAPAAQTLSTRALTGVTLYEPEELVLSARAGTPLRDIERLLETHRQQLAFEPIDYGSIYNAPRQTATIGGAIAVNASGPRRIKAGAARDHLLGFHAVTGRGDIVKSGGRVMKNVTGFDLSKLVCGSYGTLALLTEVTLKVLPKPETEQSLLILGLDEATSLALLRRAAGTPFEVSGFAMTPGGMMPGVDVNAAALRIEGPKISVNARRDALLATLVDPSTRIMNLQAAHSQNFWASIRDAEPVARQSGQIWRLSVAPSNALTVVDALRRNGAPLHAHFYDWAGGLIWLAFAPAPDAHAPLVRAAVDAVGGHATLIRADDAVRAHVDVFHPQPAALAALSQRVKDAFDPAHVLERGRMRAEF